MVVDDSADVRRLMATRLLLSGYEVIEARTGPEAVSLAREHRPAVIFMDANVSVKDGLAAARLLRNVKELSAVAVVVFSAFRGGDDNRPALDSCRNAYVNQTDDIINLPSIVQGFLPVA